MLPTLFMQHRCKAADWFVGLSIDADVVAVSEEASNSKSASPPCDGRPLSCSSADQASTPYISGSEEGELRIQLAPTGLSDIITDLLQSPRHSSVVIKSRSHTSEVQS
nr:hypothetical protein CFP56_21205 [Quercus suber]